MIFSLQAGFEQQLLSPQSVSPSGDVYDKDIDDDDYDDGMDEDGFSLHAVCSLNTSSHPIVPAFKWVHQTQIITSAPPVP